MFLDLTWRRRSTPLFLEFWSRGGAARNITFSLLTPMSLELDLTSQRRSKKHNFFLAHVDVFRFELTAEKHSGPSPAVAEEEAAVVKSEARKPRGRGRPPVAEVTAQVQPPYWDLPILYSIVLLLEHWAFLRCYRQRTHLGRKYHMLLTCYLESRIQSAM